MWQRSRKKNNRKHGKGKQKQQDQSALLSTSKEGMMKKD